MSGVHHVHWAYAASLAVRRVASVVPVVGQCNDDLQAPLSCSCNNCVQADEHRLIIFAWCSLQIHALLGCKAEDADGIEATPCCNEQSPVVSQIYFNARAHMLHRLLHLVWRASWQQPWVEKGWAAQHCTGRQPFQRALMICRPG